MLLDRHRVARLIELSGLAERLGPADRTLRAGEVEVLITAAYDDASDAARREFMQQVRSPSRTAWPWSAVTAGRGAPPPLLTLLRGQVIAADDDPGDRLPSRGGFGSAAFEALHQALLRWDTDTIRRHIGPQGWIAASRGQAGAVARDRGFEPGFRASMNLGAAGGVRPGRGGSGAGGNAPAGETGTGEGAAGAGTSGSAPSEGGTGSTAPPAGAPTETSKDVAVPTWDRGAIVVAASVGVGAVGLVALAVSRARQERALRTLRERLREYEP